MEATDCSCSLQELPGSHFTNFCQVNSLVAAASLCGTPTGTELVPHHSKIPARMCQSYSKHVPCFPLEKIKATPLMKTSGLGQTLLFNRIVKFAHCVSNSISLLLSVCPNTGTRHVCVLRNNSLDSRLGC